jgi:ABC-type transport system involved in multi-copper enzyme maturation permease subunit
MTDALRYEWLRIRTIRSTYWLTGLAIAFAVLVSVAVAWAMRSSMGGADAPSQADLAEVGPWLGTQFARAGAPYFLAYLLAMIGILSWGHEYRHGMVRATLTALNSRVSVWVAKYLVALLWVALTVTVAFLLAVLVGWLFLSGKGVELWHERTFEALGRAVVYTVLLTAMAMAFTGLVRNQTAALVLLFLWPLAIENIITLVFFLVPGLREHSDVTRFLPFSAGGRINSDSFFARGEEMFGQPLTWVGGLVVFGGICAVLMVLSQVLFSRRDA